MKTLRAPSAVPPAAAPSTPSTPAPRRRRRRWAWVAAATLGVVALGALGTVAAVHVARAEVADRLTALASARGLRVRWSAIELPVFDGAVVRDLEVSAASDGRLIARIRAAETDVSLMGALGGQRRPGAVVLRGVEAHLALIDGKVSGLEGLSGAAEAAEPSGDVPAEPLRIALAGGRISVDVQQSGVALERVTLTDLTGEVTRDAARRIALSGKATVAIGDRTTAAQLSGDSEGHIALSFDAPMHLGAATPWGPVGLTLRELRRDPARGRTELVGAGAAREHSQIIVGRLTLDDHATGPLPRLADFDLIAAEQVTVEHGGARLVAARVETRFGAADPDGWPVPREITARDAGVETTSRDLRGTFGGATLTLIEPLAAWRAGRPLDAIATIALSEPRFVATVALPAAAPAEPGAAPDAPPAPAEEGQVSDVEALLARILADTQLPGEGPDGTKPEQAGDAPAKPGAGPPPSPDVAEGREGRLAGLVARLRAWKLAVDHGVIDVRDPEGAPLLVLEGFGLTTREAEGGVLEVDVQAEVKRGGERTGKVDASVGFDPRGGIVHAAGRVSGKDLASQVSRFTPHVTVQPEAEVDLRFEYDRPEEPGAPFRVTGEAHLSHFTFQYWRVADTEVKDLEADVTFDLSVYKDQHRVALSLPDIRIGEARLAGSLDVTLAPKKKPRFAIALSMPDQDCGAVARAIPPALIPRLSTLAAQGRMSFDASLTADLADPYGLELRVLGDLDACTVTSLGPGIDFESLRGDFVHVPVEPDRGRLEHIRVGRGTKEWVEGARLPELVKATAWITEDRKFFDHKGVRWDLVERALKMDLEHGRFIYGGSTVTQQLVKNLYLDRGKSLARKLEEAIIAWQMERVLTKDEILTIYVNVIEYGPDIYGVKHAARHYFGKRVDELDGLEVAFIMGLKPYPANGHRQWKNGKLKDWWVTRVKKVLSMVVSRSDTLTAEQAEAFGPDYAPKFRPADGADGASPDGGDADPPGDVPADDAGGGEAWDPWKR